MTLFRRDLTSELPARMLAWWRRPSASRERAWAVALEEHEQVLTEYMARLRSVPMGRWYEPVAEGKWSPAEEALHLVLAYEIGLSGAIGGDGMRMVASPAWAWLSRSVVLPVMLHTQSFPRGAAAPREVRPASRDARSLSKEALEVRLRQVATDAAKALRTADGRKPSPRLVHAYFGPLTPLTTLQLLSAHTRHHTRRR